MMLVENISATHDVLSRLTNQSYFGKKVHPLFKSYTMNEHAQTLVSIAVGPIS